MQCLNNNKKIFRPSSTNVRYRLLLVFAKLFSQRLRWVSSCSRIEHFLFLQRMTFQPAVRSSTDTSSASSSDSSSSSSSSSGSDSSSSSDSDSSSSQDCERKQTVAEAGKKTAAVQKTAARKSVERKVKDVRSQAKGENGNSCRFGANALEIVEPNFYSYVKSYTFIIHYFFFCFEQLHLKGNRHRRVRFILLMMTTREKTEKPQLPKEKIQT